MNRGVKESYSGETVLHRNRRSSTNDTRGESVYFVRYDESFSVTVVGF